MSLVKEYFKDYELACKCGCGKMPDNISIEMLYSARIILNEPVIITSGARCESHNAGVGGRENSTHLIGAFDTSVQAYLEWRWIQILQFVGFNGIGFQDNTFIHADRHRIDSIIWGY